MWCVGPRSSVFVSDDDMMCCAGASMMEMSVMFRHLPLVHIRSVMVRDLATGRAPGLVQQIDKHLYRLPNNKHRCRMTGLVPW